MGKWKHLFIVLILVFLSIIIYQNYIYYQIPRNPLVELDSDAPDSCYFRLYYPDDTLSVTSHNVKNNALIFKYFSDLNLMPLKEKKYRDEISFKSINDIHCSFGFKFTSSTSSYYVRITEIWLDDLSAFSIRASSIDGFPNGYYQIIDSKLDYMYLYNLITDSLN